MEQIFSQLFYEVEKYRDTVLVTLIADRGSAPGRPGHRCWWGRRAAWWAPSAAARWSAAASS